MGWGQKISSGNGSGWAACRNEKPEKTKNGGVMTPERIKITFSLDPVFHPTALQIQQLPVIAARLRQAVQEAGLLIVDVAVEYPDQSAQKTELSQAAYWWE